MGHALACPLLLAINVVGYNDMAGLFDKLEALFLKRHPGTQFNIRLKGTATAAPALTLGVSDLAPMGAEFSDMELEAYRSYVGADPIPIRVAHCSLNPRALSAPVGIYVNEANPIRNLSADQVARIFTTGHGSGDITRWGQAGLKAEWAARPIHPTGIAEEAAAGLASFMLKTMSAARFTSAYDSFSQSTEVVRHVREDPEAVGFASGNIALPGTRRVTVDETALTESNVVSGKYPYDRYLLIYVRQVDPVIKDLLRLALSKEGQQAIASAPPNYLPLNENEVTAELAKLDLPPSNRSPNIERSRTKLELYRLITGQSSHALIDREIWPLEQRPFRQNYGYDPFEIRIAHSGRTGVYVNSKNPLHTLSVDQVARIFTSGAGGGDITRWAQLGWTDRAIHTYGPHDDGRFVTALRHAKLGGFPFARVYEPLGADEDVIEAVIDDPYGIAIAPANAEKPGPANVRTILLRELSSYLNFYVNRAPGKPLDAATEKYARELLSSEGQMKLSRQGYGRLSPQEVALELTKL